MKHPARAMYIEELRGRLLEEAMAGNVSMKTDGDLILYCYTKQCVFERAWNDVTVLARGLIINVDTGEIVATPFPKFFNYGERSNSFPDVPYEVFEKMDGSMITVFHDGVEWRTATKGSFNSDQARAAALILDASHLTKGATYLFEYVGPTNRIVVPYDKEALVLLAAYDSNGIEYSWEDLRWLTPRHPIATRHLFNSFSELVETVKNLPATSEGFVIRFQGGHRLKMKGDAYCNVHRFISRVTPLEIWRAMVAGESMVDFVGILPEEFHKDFYAIFNALQTNLWDEWNRINQLRLGVTDVADRDLINVVSIKKEDMSLVRAMRKESLMNNPRARRSLYERIRPTANVLDGYTPSRSLKLFETESA